MFFLSLKLSDARKYLRERSRFCWTAQPTRSFTSNVTDASLKNWTGKRRVSLCFVLFASRVFLRVRSKAAIPLHVKETVAAYRRDRLSSMLNIMPEISVGNFFITSTVVTVKKPETNPNILLKVSIVRLQNVDWLSRRLRNTYIDLPPPFFYPLHVYVPTIAPPPLSVKSCVFKSNVFIYNLQSNCYCWQKNLSLFYYELLSHLYTLFFIVIFKSIYFVYTL